MSNPVYIRDLGLTVADAQDTAFRHPITGLPTGEEVTTWTNAVLTIREDPDWPRDGPEQVEVARGQADPSGWTAAVTCTTFSAESATVARFAITAADMAALQPGVNRYVMDVWRTDAGKVWQVVKPTWLTVLPSLR